MKDILVRIVGNEYVCLDVESNQKLCKSSTKKGAIEKLLFKYHSDDIQLFVQEDIKMYLPSQYKKSVPVIIEYLKMILNSSSKDEFIFSADEIATELNLQKNDVRLYYQKHVNDCKMRCDTNRTRFIYSKANDPFNSLLHDN